MAPIRFQPLQEGAQSESDQANHEPTTGNYCYGIRKQFQEKKYFVKCTINNIPRERIFNGD